MAQLTSDAYRRAYLADLDLQIENNEKNLQANLLHKRTGQVSTQITDYRTVTDKLADVVALRADVRKNLTQICDVPTAGEIVRECTDDEIRFLAQRIQSIVAELKPKYRYGVPAVSFMTYLRKVMKHTGITGDVDPGLTIVGQIADLQDAMIKKPDLDRLATTIDHCAQGQSKELMAVIHTDLSKLVRIVVEVEQLKATLALSTGSRQKSLARADMADQLDRLLVEGLGNLPTPARLAKLDGDIQARVGDYKSITQVLFEAHQDLDQPASRVDMVSQALALARAELKPEAEQAPLAAATPRGKGALREALSRLGDVDPAERAEAERLALAGSSAAEIVEALRPTPDLPELPHVYDITESKLKKMSAANAKALLDPYVDLLAANGVEGPEEDIHTGVPSKATYLQWRRDHLDEIKKEFDDRTAYVKRKASFGTGLRRIRGRGIIDETKGVKDKLKFAPLGRYYVNIHKLNDDILCMSRATGTNIPTLKTRRLSQELACVFRKLVNGGVPSFTELAALNTADRDEYANVARQCQFAGGDIEIPPTSSDAELTKFEIMKGEILSGNDSTDLIKQFKAMIIKLAHNGRLPKGQAKDLLMDLAALGY